MKQQTPATEQAISVRISQIIAGCVVSPAEYALLANQ
jgi:hypothetical protein